MKYAIVTELTLQQVIQLQYLVGICSNMTPLFNTLVEITEGAGIPYEDVDVEDYLRDGDFLHTPFQKDRLKLALEAGGKKVITIGDSMYYEDELQRALSNIKPLNQ